MASITVIEVNDLTRTLIEVTFTTDDTLRKVELTNDGINYISATTYTQTSAIFDISSWSNGTYNECKLRATYATASSGGDNPGGSLPGGGDSGGDSGSTGGGDSGGGTTPDPGGSETPGGGDTTGDIVLFDNGLTSGYTISNGANYTVGDKITLSHGANTYFGFDQSVTFNAGDSISFVIDTCGSDASAYITRICYLDNNNTLQGYETSVTDDVVSAGLPYILTHTFTSKTTIKPALMKYFGNITISKVYVTRT